MHKLVLVLAASGLVAGAVALHGQQPTAPKIAAPPDAPKLTLSQRHLQLAGQRGVEWLQRANRPDGRFVFGYLPALRTVLEGDDYLSQAGAAFALARASQAYKDERSAAIARQALLTLLLETVSDSQDATLRYTRLPSELLNRLAAAGMLTMAIHNLPDPGKDLLEQANGLCAYIRRQQRPDGSLKIDEKNPKADGAVADDKNDLAGPALFGLIASQRHLPASWKIECLRNGRRFYMANWHKQKNLEMLPWHSAAYAEAYRQSKDKTFADSVFEMNDWLCGLQYDQLNPLHSAWAGGFKRIQNGSEVLSPPDMQSAHLAISLAEACRTARQAGDVARWQRYRSALELCLQFVTTLQYTDGNTQHFVETFRPVLVGAFHPSHQDGDLRLDCTQHAVTALSLYVEYVMTADP